MAEARMARMVATARTSMKVVPRSLRRTGVSFLEDGGKLQIHPRAAFVLSQSHLIDDDESLRRLDPAQEIGQMGVGAVEGQSDLAADEIGALDLLNRVRALLRQKARLLCEPLDFALRSEE